MAPPLVIDKDYQDPGPLLPDIPESFTPTPEEIEIPTEISELPHPETPPETHDCDHIDTDPPVPTPFVDIFGNEIANPPISPKLSSDSGSTTPLESTTDLEPTTSPLPAENASCEEHEDGPTPGGRRVLTRDPDLDSEDDDQDIVNLSDLPPAPPSLAPIRGRAARDLLRC